MQLFAAVSTALALYISPVLATRSAVQPKTVERFAGAKKPSSYIFKLKDGVSKEAQFAELTPEYGASATMGQCTFGTDTLNAFRSNPDIESVAEDGIVSIAASVTQCVLSSRDYSVLLTLKGLERISSTAEPSNQNTSALTFAFTYTYGDSAGEGVDTYIVGGRPSVARGFNLSGASTSFDTAITAPVNQGIHGTVAASNANAARPSSATTALSSTPWKCSADVRLPP
ncbi:hypothetical protein C8Q80DRAFT_1121860 [Daedaleopsis nitida]|nr:hypothetical protein C8Q80DRAFT_1121860 [Daedaleopsis nitida]